MPAGNALSYIGSVKPNVAMIAAEVYKLYPQLKVIWGYNPASQPEHSAGLALDFMVYESRTLGDAIAEYLWQNRERLGVRWLIWRQRIRSTTPGKGDNWRAMADRGNVTANHMDHIHVFFRSGSYMPPPRTLPPVVDGFPRTIDLTKLREAAKRDGARQQGGVTSGAEESVRYVEAMLVGKKLLSKAYALDGSFGTATVAAYSQWQRSLGYTGADADGIPGRVSLQKLIEWWSPGNYVIKP